jgi:hypothetical protein
MLIEVAEGCRSLARAPSRFYVVFRADFSGLGIVACGSVRRTSAIHRLSCRGWLEALPLPRLLLVYKLAHLRIREGARP